MFESIIFTSLKCFLPGIIIGLSMAVLNNNRLVNGGDLDENAPYRFDIIYPSNHVINEEPVQVPNIVVNNNLGIAEVVNSPRTEYLKLNVESFGRLYGTENHIINRYPSGLNFGANLRSKYYDAWFEYNLNRPLKKSMDWFEYTTWQAEFDCMNSYLFTYDKLFSTAEFFRYQANETVYMLNETLSVSDSLVNTPALCIALTTLVSGLTDFSLLYIKTGISLNIHVSQVIDCYTYNFHDALIDDSVANWISWVNRKSGVLSWNCFNLARLIWRF